jgi:tetrahydromethanopterin S-methyltransferase subunit G
MKAHKNDDNTTRIAVLETTVGHIHETLERIEKNIEKGFTEVNQRIDNIDNRFREVNQRIDNLVYGQISSGY